MTEDTDTQASKPNIWLRGLYMLLLAVIFHVSGTVMFAIAIIQFVLALLGGPNDRLSAFGRSLSRYLQQTAAFLTFATDEMPFPFSDWPSGQ